MKTTEHAETTGKSFLQQKNCLCGLCVLCGKNRLYLRHRRHSSQITLLENNNAQPTAA